MRKTILLLLLSLITNISFSQSQEEQDAINFLNNYLKEHTFKPVSNFNGDLKFDNRKIKYHMNIKRLTLMILTN